MTQLQTIGDAVIHGIIDGEFDEVLSDIQDALNARNQSIRVTVFSEFKVGDRFVINDTISPKYLKGCTGVVTDKPTGGKWLLTDIDSGCYTGRYRHKGLKLSPMVMDKVETNGAQ